MSKSLMFTLIGVLLSTSAFAQVQPVVVVTDSLATQAWQLEQAVQAIETVKNGVAMIQYQIKALESLDQGSLDGFIQYMDNQTRTVAAMQTGLQNALQLTAQYDAEGNAIYNADILNAAQAAQNLRSRMDNINNLLYAAGQLSNNAQDRNAEALRLSALADTATSPVQQMQILNDQFGLLQADLRDISFLLQVSNAAVLEERERERAEKEYNEKMKADFFTGKSDYQVEQMYSDAENRALRNFENVPSRGPLR